ncbi:unnamed protein product [Moneuplotes crassus]|uniref:Uncharacterized protein n=1 Tax=Euplotes crassus TaxID=5936 RepID=A0AAD1UFV1_EUPCR|nr:unnamed protein product [Moneuplotes crassus]
MNNRANYSSYNPVPRLDVQSIANQLLTFKPPPWTGGLPQSTSRDFTLNDFYPNIGCHQNCATKNNWVNSTTNNGQEMKSSTQLGSLSKGRCTCQNAPQCYWGPSAWWFQPKNYRVPQNYNYTMKPKDFYPSESRQDPWQTQFMTKRSKAKPSQGKKSLLESLRKCSKGSEETQSSSKQALNTCDIEIIDDFTEDLQILRSSERSAATPRKSQGSPGQSRKLSQEDTEQRFDYSEPSVALSSKNEKSGSTLYFPGKSDNDLSAGVNTCARDSIDQTVILIQDDDQDSLCESPRRDSIEVALITEEAQSCEIAECNKKRHRKANSKSGNFFRNRENYAKFPIRSLNFQDGSNFMNNSTQKDVISLIDRVPNTLRGVTKVTPAPSIISEVGEKTDCIVVDISEDELEVLKADPNNEQDAEIMSITNDDYYCILGDSPRIGPNYQLSVLPELKKPTRENLLAEEYKFILCFDATKHQRKFYTNFVEKCRAGINKSNESKKIKTKFREELALKYLACKDYDVNQAYNGIVKNKKDFRELKNLNKVDKTIEKREKEMLLQEIYEDKLIFQ